MSVMLLLHCGTDTYSVDVTFNCNKFLKKKRHSEFCSLLLFSSVPIFDLPLLSLSAMHFLLGVAASPSHVVYAAVDHQLLMTFVIPLMYIMSLLFR